VVVTVQVFEELQHVAFGQDVETEGGFIKEQDVRFVQQRQCEVGPHALAETQFAGQAVEKVVQAEQVHQDA
jgi:hypothetical protein